MSTTLSQYTFSNFGLVPTRFRIFKLQLKTQFRCFEKVFSFFNFTHDNVGQTEHGLANCQEEII